MTTPQVPQRGGIRRLYSVLWTHARGMRGRFVVALSLLITAQLMRIALPWMFGRAIDELQLQGLEGLRRAGAWLLAMLATVIVAWVMHGPARIVERRTALFAREQLADSLFGRVLSLPLRWHERHHSGDTLYRLQKTTAALFGFAQNQFIYLQNIVSIIGPIVALLAVSAITGGVALVGYTIVAILLLRFDRVMIRLVRAENAADGRYTASVVDSVGNISGSRARCAARCARATSRCRSRSGATSSSTRPSGRRSTCSTA